MNKTKIAMFVVLLFLFFVFFSFQTGTLYKEVFVFVNDPVNVLPKIAQNYAVSNIVDYLKIKNVRAQADFPHSLESAFKVAREKDIPYLLEIRASLISMARSENGYSVQLQTSLAVYELSNFTPKLSSTANESSENSISSEIAFSYALYNGAIKAFHQIESSFFELIKR
jgi:hypothetical protein